MANAYQEFCKLSAQSASALRNTSYQSGGKEERMKQKLNNVSLHC